MLRLPFESHDIFIMQDNELYKLRSDFSKVEVQRKDYFTPSGVLKKKQPVIILDKGQFIEAKGFLLNEHNPFRLEVEDAELYFRIGFLTRAELEDYLRKVR